MRPLRAVRHRAARWWRTVHRSRSEPGSTQTRSNRIGRSGRAVPSARWPRASMPYAACRTLRRLGLSTVSSGRPKPRSRRQRTSTMTRVGGRPGSIATRSSSPRPTLTLRPRTVQPIPTRCAAARCSAVSPACCAAVRCIPGGRCSMPLIVPGTARLPMRRDVSRSGPRLTCGSPRRRERSPLRERTRACRGCRCRRWVRTGRARQRGRRRDRRP